MTSKRFKWITAALAIALSVQVLVPGRPAAAAQTIEQLPEPEWSYKLPEGQSFWNTIDSQQSQNRLFVPMIKKVTVSPTQTKTTGMLYASLDRVNGAAHWVYDYSDIANEKPFTFHKFYAAPDGNSYFVKNKGNILYDLSAVGPNGKLKWTKSIANSYSPIMLNNGNMLIRSLVNMKTSSITFTEYNTDGKQLRNQKLTGKWTSGILEVLPNGYVTHDVNEKSSISIYRSLGSLQKPLATYTAPKTMSDPYFNVLPFSGGSFMIEMKDKSARLLIGFDAAGTKKWVRTLNTNDTVLVSGNNYLIRSDNVYRLYSKDDQLLGKQQIGESKDRNWYLNVTPSGEFTVQKQYQWQERPADIDPETFEGDVAREDFYVLNPANLQISYHLSTLWVDWRAGNSYIYAGKGELYLRSDFAPHTITKYMLK